jgi:colanic acid biosynthesis protein WcaH
MFVRQQWKANSEEEYLYILQNTPLVSVDLLVIYEGKYLVGKRLNKPAQGYYFVPGARVFKNEPISEAVYRVLESECNISERGLCPKFLGTYEHYYPDNFSGKPGSTQYFVMAHKICITKEQRDNIVSDSQHSSFMWLNEQEILDRDDVHQYVKNYFINKPDNMIL